MRCAAWSNGIDSASTRIFSASRTSIGDSAGATPGILTPPRRARGRSPASQLSARNWGRLALGALCSVVLLWLMIRRVPVQSIASAVEAAPVGLLLIAGAAAVTFNLIRALRYRVLLGSAQRVPIIQLAGVSTTAWAVSLALPSVFGDAAFVWLLRRTTRVGATKGAAAALVARVADVGSFVVIVPLATLVLGLRLPTAAVAAVAVIAAGGGGPPGARVLGGGPGGAVA